MTTLDAARILYAGLPQFRPTSPDADAVKALEATEDRRKAALEAIHEAHDRLSELLETPTADEAGADPRMVRLIRERAAELCEALNLLYAAEEGRL